MSLSSLLVAVVMVDILEDLEDLEGAQGLPAMIAYACCGGTSPKAGSSQFVVGSAIRELLRRLSPSSSHSWVDCPRFCPLGPCLDVRECSEDVHLLLWH